MKYKELDKEEFERLLKLDKISIEEMLSLVMYYLKDVKKVEVDIIPPNSMLNGILLSLALTTIKKHYEDTKK